MYQARDVITKALAASPAPYSIRPESGFHLWDQSDASILEPHIVRCGTVDPLFRTMRQRAKRYVGERELGLYGRFTFEDDCPHQIWAGGGIGIEMARRIWTVG